VDDKDDNDGKDNNDGKDDDDGNEDDDVGLGHGLYDYGDDGNRNGLSWCWC
jgi:hypothetical protein